MDLDSPVETIPRVSAIYAKRLNRLGIKTVRDLIYHFPLRYDDLSKIAKIGDAQANEIVTVRGQIINIHAFRTPRKRMFLIEALIKDNSGTIRAIWFNQPFLLRALKKGEWVSLAGKVNYDGKTLFFSNPAHETIRLEQLGAGNKSASRHTGRLVPIYPETTKLTSKWLRYILDLIFPKAINEFKDFLPAEIRKSQKLVDLSAALKKIHFPQTQKDIDEARRRLGFDELFLIQLFILQQKQKWQLNRAAIIKFDQNLIKKFVASLPFKLTNAQRKASWEILQNLEKTTPMNRLLEGDVGSGKTVVATIAALQTIKNGYQVAFMAPTEILARQHFEGLSKSLMNLGLKIALTTSSETKISYDSPLGNHQEIEEIKPKDFLRMTKEGKINIAIGTHSLIQESVQFKNLALAIVDEQHRFGVQQRAALQKNIVQMEDGLKTTIPHLLSMTATPIPRTLALTIYGDLDLSLLNELPKGRQKTITKIIAPANRQKAYDFIRQQIKGGRQVFVICPRIERQSSDGNGNETRVVNSQSPDVTTGQNEHRNQLTLYDKRRLLWVEVKAVTEEYKKLSEKTFPDLKVAMLHGKIKAKEKEQVMRDFREKKYDILVSTSVVEVGVDIPNATVMMIEGADRFGLAQLHQFRGRVGRDKFQSYCLLFTDSDSQFVRQRLKALVSTQNGFELAEKDLEIRGPGEFYGTRQWGLPDLTMASLMDVELIKECRKEAEKLLADDSPELTNHPLLADRLKKFQLLVHLE
ncbi:MAG: DNA helicase RecG [Candidatus Portnoybacteria bacterium CG09_land_8_20_14_0_10_44_13]|uniref:ATP-dependent DNA helicase RecG n=2 Tax=Candidatus Portnoyibacteriota TaxID=1817913 RepID=A0A2H0WWQ3_9BACT|nr:MAG: DNA helicase RecG [Candidatus Portnoybacteria bacterium CG09_land_8_20_14_0_10_44_13]PJA63570.1 MAG: DNA helicase RecG [Candidatus Portnoybacteria bacterium CG_4_9_14_3_um_filter_44_9]